MSVGLAWKSAAKINEKLVNQKYATLFLSWMPFNYSLKNTCTSIKFVFSCPFENLYPLDPTNQEQALIDSTSLESSIIPYSIWKQPMYTYTL